jgi:hypothetical protein
MDSPGVDAKVAMMQLLARTGQRGSVFELGPLDLMVSRPIMGPRGVVFSSEPSLLPSLLSFRL